MKTIRMPRRMGEITERLPAPQYDQVPFKRTNSQPQLKLDAIDADSNKKKLLQSASKPAAHHSVRHSMVDSKTPSMSQLNLGNQMVEVESKSLI